MAVGLNEVYEKLGLLQATVQRLAEDFERQGERSDASRANMHRRLDEAVERIGKLETGMATVTEIKEVTDQVIEWKQRGIGALGMIGIASAALGSGVTYYFNDILHLIRGG